MTFWFGGNLSNFGVMLARMTNTNKKEMKNATWHEVCIKGLYWSAGLSKEPIVKSCGFENGY